MHLLAIEEIKFLPSGIRCIDRDRRDSKDGRLLYVPVMVFVLVAKGGRSLHVPTFVGRCLCLCE